MSIFDDDESEEDEFYYDTNNAYQRHVLESADNIDEHPIAYLAMGMAKDINAMETFVEQDLKITKAERVAVMSDIREIQEAMQRVTSILPMEVNNEHDQR